MRAAAALRVRSAPGRITEHVTQRYLVSARTQRLHVEE